MALVKIELHARFYSWDSSLTEMTSTFRLALVMVSIASCGSTEENVKLFIAAFV